VKLFPNFKELKFRLFFALRKCNCLNKVSFAFLAKNMLNFKHLQQGGSLTRLGVSLFYFLCGKESKNAF